MTKRFMYEAVFELLCSRCGISLGYTVGDIVEDEWHFCSCCAEEVNL